MGLDSPDKKPTVFVGMRDGTSRQVDVTKENPDRIAREEGTALPLLEAGMNAKDAALLVEHISQMGDDEFSAFEKAMVRFEKDAKRQGLYKNEDAFKTAWNELAKAQGTLLPAGISTIVGGYMLAGLEGVGVAAVGVVAGSSSSVVIRGIRLKSQRQGAKAIKEAVKEKKDQE